MENVFLAGMMGLVVGDALGVPVEFEHRAVLDSDPVTDMRAYGTHNQPCGTWSDDSSMALATLDSLRNGLDYLDIMTRFSDWVLYGKYTPYGDVFDIGRTTLAAILRYGKGISPIECGGKREHDNGNGSLMRILPVVLQQYFFYHGNWQENRENILEVIHNVSALTHAHPRSKIACGIFAEITAALLTEKEKKIGEEMDRLLQNVMDAIFSFYQKYASQITIFKRLKDMKSFMELDRSEISSSGYVLDTLEAAIWCFLNSKSYEECVLMAVNLGGDTDTVGAVSGAMAGVWYGYQAIPEQWKNVIAKREQIEMMCTQINFKYNL